MSDLLDEYQRRLRKALLQIQEMSAELKARDAEQHEPIAVIGMACRFPGECSTPTEFFQYLMDGKDAVTEVPAKRKSLLGNEAILPDSDLAGVRWGAFIEDIEFFDAPFFELSPREVTRMDPQHRLVLELGWEALENAGIVLDAQRKQRTGVFIGLTSSDYSLHRSRVTSEPYDVYDISGNGHCFSAGRIAYHFDLHGPCVSVDTACSSSLVATHLACQSLRSKDCDVALVAGVNLLLEPQMSRALARANATSPDGRARSFDARANGFVRGEGCGAIILMRQSHALREGFRIMASLLGSAINQDGRSVGFTAPSVTAQQALIREALRRARVAPESIGFVETHGTGTSLGDPIEAEALGNVFGPTQDRTRTCYLGALKTNVGHLEAAAGIAGLIKTVHVVSTGNIPKNLHFRSLNPLISFEDSPLAIPQENTPWPQNTKPRRAGVSSFGMSGTNAHVIIEEPPVPTRQTPIPEASSYLLPLSAKSPDALAAMTQKYAQWFTQNKALPLYDIAYTAAVRRTHLDHRAFVVAGSHEEFSTILKTVTRDKISSTPPISPRKIAFVFPGQGSQWLGMGRQLLADEPAFRAALEACDAAIRQEAGFSILDEIAASESSSNLNKIDVVQPLLFAIEVALAALWRSWGVEPDYVIGHSMGEVAAAHVAGALSLLDAAKIICRRSRLLTNLCGKGAMALVELTPSDAEEAIANHKSALSIAVVNGPRSTVISGDPIPLGEVLEKLEQRGVFCQRINADVASHSPQVDSIYRALVDELADISPNQLQIPMHSTVTGRDLRGSELVPSYWAENLRNRVLFFQVVEHYIEEGATIFLEISPHPVLLHFIDEALQGKNVPGAVLASLRFKRSERNCMLDSLGSIYKHGFNIDWAKIYPVHGHVVQLPSYAWQRQRYWIETTKSLPRVIATAVNVPTFSSTEPANVPSGQTTASVRENILALPLAEQERYLEGHVLEQTGTVVKLHPSQINPQAPFSTLGIDSLMSLELRNRLERELSVKLPATLIFSFPTPAALVKHLAQELQIGAFAPSTETQASEPAMMASTSEDEIMPDDIEALLESKLADLDKFLD